MDLWKWMTFKGQLPGNKSILALLYEMTKLKVYIDLPNNSLNFNTRIHANTLYYICSNVHNVIYNKGSFTWNPAFLFSLLYLLLRLMNTSETTLSTVYHYNYNYNYKDTQLTNLRYFFVYHAVPTMKAAVLFSKNWSQSLDSFKISYTHLWGFSTIY